MMSGGDIAKQLPSEHALFVSGNTDLLPKGLQLRDPFLSLLQQILIHYIVNLLTHVGYGESLQESYRSASRSCTVDGLLAVINHMDEGRSRKDSEVAGWTNTWRRTKRMVFPRFYFVSDDDLLEILGQSKDPMAVQKHIHQEMLPRVRNALFIFN